MTEADTCRKFIVPLLQAAGWDNDPYGIAEQRSITDGRIVPVGKGFTRKKNKRVDYLLKYRRDRTLAVVEAKAHYKKAADGMQQAKDYATLLDLKFCYASNGKEILEFDFFTGLEREVTAYPGPEELWQRYLTGRGLKDAAKVEQMLTPYKPETGKPPRYYQQVAIDRTVDALLAGKQRILLTMATGTGKTTVAFQICWRLWQARWNVSGEYRKPRILFLADRNKLVDDPKDKDFAPFGDARNKIESGQVVKSREMYFAIYQALAEDGRREGLFKQFPPDFFDLVIIDECHRGSARDDSSWRSILDHFSPAAKLGLTATPLREDNRDTYLYFGNPLYEYSLRQGIEDGFLAPYRVHRVISEWDAAGWRPSKEMLDRYGRAIPDEEYGTKDFERSVALRARTHAIARHLSDFLRKTDRFAKTIVFCVDQEHASDMRAEINNLNADLVAQHPDYVCRVTSDEAEIGMGHLNRFQDLDKRTPVILTTSQLLTTGVDAPTCKNVVLARVVGSMSEFKQIIGRGTRVRDDYDKLWFNIIDYTGSATRLFADPDFDGEPARVTEEDLENAGRPNSGEPEEDIIPSGQGDGVVEIEPPTVERRKFYYDGGSVEIAAHLVYDLDPDGKQLRVTRYTDYAAERVRSLCPSTPELRKRWADPVQRNELIEALKQRGIDFTELAEAAKQPEADPFDLLCHLAYNAPLRTRRERARMLKENKRDFFARYSGEAKQILEELVEKYAEHGDAQFALPDVLHVPPISMHGSITEISKAFGGAEQLRKAVQELQTLLYAA